MLLLFLGGIAERIKLMADLTSILSRTLLYLEGISSQKISLLTNIPRTKLCLQYSKNINIHNYFNILSRYVCLYRGGCPVASCHASINFNVLFKTLMLITANFKHHETHKLFKFKISLL